MQDKEYYMPVVKHAGGRPTKYSEAILDKTRQYIEGLSDSEDVVPSYAGLALYLGVNKDTIQDWRKQEDKQEFSVLLKSINTMQEQVLLNNGLTGAFNPHITKAILAKHHGYSDNDNNKGNITINVSREAVSISDGNDTVTIDSK